MLLLKTQQPSVTTTAAAATTLTAAQQALHSHSHIYLKVTITLGKQPIIKKGRKERYFSKGRDKRDILIKANLIYYIII